MRTIKKFDYFRKTDQKNKTRTGGVVSILSVLVSAHYNSLVNDHKDDRVHQTKKFRFGILYS